MNCDEYRADFITYCLRDEGILSLIPYGKDYALLFREKEPESEEYALIPFRWFGKKKVPTLFDGVRILREILNEGEEE